MEKKLVKLAVIRDNDEHVCPFGLHIPDACFRAGKTTEQMTPVLKVDPDGFDTVLIKDKNQLSEVVKANIEVLMWGNEEPAQCVYANKLFDGKEKVECNYGDRAAGIGQAEFLGSPSYTQYFSSGYAAVPLGFSGVPSGYNQNGSFESMVGMSGSYASESDQEKIKK